MIGTILHIGGHGSGLDRPFNLSLPASVFDFPAPAEAKHPADFNTQPLLNKDHSFGPLVIWYNQLLHSFTDPRKGRFKALLCTAYSETCPAHSVS